MAEMLRLVKFGPDAIILAHQLLTNPVFRAAWNDIKTRALSDPQAAKDVLAVVGEVHDTFASLVPAVAPKAAVPG